MSDGFLHRYFLNNGHRKLHKWVHYFDIYERHFERFRGKSPKILEIGVQGGGSLAMWKEYFGAGAQIVGVDIDPECAKHKADNIDVYIGSQDDPRVFKPIIDKYGSFDIIIDDGSHKMEHMIKSFQMLYMTVQPNGVYLVEDTHTCYLTSYGGGLRKKDSFLEISKRLVDELHAAYTKGKIPVTEFSKTADSITFYDSVIVFEKRPQGLRQAPVTGPMDMDYERPLHLVPGNKPLSNV